MKFLFLSINYHPELTGIGKYTGEMCDWLVRQGHEVTVVTGLPYYPHWKIADNYKSFFYYKEKINGVDVIRCPLWVPSKPTGVKRLLHLFSFWGTSLPVMLLAIVKRPDIVFSIEPPFFGTLTALMVAKLCGAISWLHIQDFEIDAAFDLGLIKGEFWRKSSMKLECGIMSKFDRVSSISSRMCEKIVTKNVKKDKTTLLPNWVDVEMIFPEITSTDNDFRKKLNIKSQDKVALYSGNMGKKQGLEVLVDVAATLQFMTDLHFVFCGDGPSREMLAQATKNLERIHFMDLQPIELLPKLLGMADVHLLPQRADVSDLVMPSKLTGMMASGRPVVASAIEGTELFKVVTGCGIVVPPEDSAAFAKAIEKLCKDDELRKQLGVEGRKYAEENWAQEVVLSNFLNEVNVLNSNL